ncbi:Y-family DNA polymerase [Shewanella marisflavi]|uniref:Y-family DNA polymerase n=1 Tax=Shewanella marisflavi TaxID=260364 RepID=UPI003AAAE5D4
MDSCYTSCEQIFNPRYRNRAMVVLSNNDGCCIAVNRLAKEAGVTKFSPFFEVKQLCEQKGIIVRSSNYELIADTSSRLMATLERFSPEIFPYSVDECFISFDRCEKVISNYSEYGQMIRKTVWREVRLPVSIGFGSTLTLSKVANRIAKRKPELRGVYCIDGEDDRIAALKLLDISDVWGVGRRLTKRLKEEFKINTAYELSQMDPSLGQRLFSIEMERLILELNGIPAKYWDQARSAKQQIFSTRSFSKKVTDLEELKQALRSHCATVARKARAQGSLCKSVLIFASSSPYGRTPFYMKELISLPYPTSSTLELCTAISLVAQKLYRNGIAYSKVGVGAIELVSERNQQQDLFNQSNANPALMKALDLVNNKYGKNTVFVAGQGIEQSWSMKRNMLSPQYTSRWSDIPKIKC